jgi:hypothetical protein
MSPIRIAREDAKFIIPRAWLINCSPILGIIYIVQLAGIISECVGLGGDAGQFGKSESQVNVQGQFGRAGASGYPGTAH